MIRPKFTTIVRTVTGDVGMGMTMYTTKTLTHPQFLKDPHACAKEVWEASRYVY